MSYFEGISGMRVHVDQVGVRGRYIMDELKYMLSCITMHYRKTG